MNSRAALFACIIGFCLANVGCSVAYVLKQGVYQLKMLRDSVPIESVINQPDLKEEQRAKLKLVIDTKKFAEESIGLHVGNNYSKINLKWKDYIYNVSACKPLRFEPYQWWFPIVGKIPYIGYFDQRDANKEHKKLEALGLEVLTRRVDGYSTLGYFSDPIWPQMLERQEWALVELILHELAHATVYFKGQASFNESFANFVGKLATKQYLAKKYGKDSNEVKSAIGYYQDEDLLVLFMHELFMKLNEVYESKLSDEEKIAKKKSIMAEQKSGYGNIKFVHEDYKKINLDRINNAYLISYKVYNTGQEDFEKLFVKVNEDWRKFFAQLKTISEHPDPIKALREIAGGEMSPTPFVIPVRG